MTAYILTAANWPIVGQLCWVLGKVMNFIYTFLTESMNVHNGAVGISIIIYTILVYTLMLPLTINQQKSARMTAIIQPEVQAIQKKYKNKKDQASMMKQQDEIQRVYDKYGTSMMGGCLPLLIQMPFLFALYPVIYRISDYVPALANAPESVQRFIAYPDLTISPSTMIHNAGAYGLPKAVIIIAAILLPVLSGATQRWNITLSQAISGQKGKQNKDDPMASTMKTMNWSMPLFSVFMVFTLPTGIGIYWIVSAIVRSVQMVIINKFLAKQSLDDLIEKNKEKAEKKAAKRKDKNDRINAMAQTNTKKLNSYSSMPTAEKEERIQKARNNASNAKKGSLASRANLVNDFNNKNK